METTASLQDIALQEQETGKKARLDYIDVAKGILILAVVLAHAWFANINILGHMVPFSMPAFFFLSGYTYKPGRGYFKNLGKRVVGLLLPYVFFSTACTLLYPVYVNLAKTPVWQQTGMGPIWTAVAKADALNMLMATPMWFLVALFTGSILFFAIADRTRGSLKWTVLSAAVLVAAALVIDVLKKNTLWWFVDLAPYTAAMMVIGAYCGNKKVFSKITLRAVLIGLVCLAVAEIVAGIGLDTDTILGALLHDCIEDTRSTYEDIEKNFGTTVADLYRAQNLVRCAHRLRHRRDGHLRHPARGPTGGEDPRGAPDLHLAGTEQHLDPVHPLLRHHAHGAVPLQSQGPVQQHYGRGGGGALRLRQGHRQAQGRCGEGRRGAGVHRTERHLCPDPQEREKGDQKQKSRLKSEITPRRFSSAAILFASDAETLPRS